MAKPLPQEAKDAFLEFCKDARENQGGWICLNNFELDGEIEFHAKNYDPANSYDWYELFDSLNEHGLAIEVHGHEDFLVVEDEAV